MVNPSKFSKPESFTTAVSDAFAALGKDAPTFIETTVEDPGWGQAKQAIADGADMVIAAGGDGTVRMVAGALAGSTTELAIIPVGTGNLMARNLSVPLEDVDAAVKVALTGARQTIDLGWLSMADEDEKDSATTPAEAKEQSPGREPHSQTRCAGGAAEESSRNSVPDESVPDEVDARDVVTEEDVDAASPFELSGETDAPDEHPFLVISGIGFDAQIMHDTDSRLKKLVGVGAYFLAGAGRIIGRSVKVSVALDGRMPKRFKARTVMIGNVGRLPGGLTLMPGADATNGSLEILALDWRGAAGFAQIATEMVAPGAPSLAQISSSRTFQARRVEVMSERTMPIQVDGDVIGSGKRVWARVQPRALSVRVGKPNG